MVCGTDFKIGYSPERINPGDKAHRLENIRKIVSGMDEESLEEIQHIYDIVIEVGTYPVSNIRTAEAIKVVENSQRDINIAFMNELAMVFDRMDIDTNEVVERHEHQVECAWVPAGTGGRPLHRRGPLLLHL